MKNTNYSVKKLQTYFILLTALLISGTINAKVNNYIGLYADFGEWTLLPTESNYGPSFGVAGGMGFMYELQAGPKYKPTRFLFNVGVGADAGMTSFMQSSNQNIILANQTDLDGEAFDYVYQLRDRQDQYKNVALKVPVMFGLHHQKFYMLAGVKLNLSLWTKTNSVANLTTYGEYASFDPFTNMPEYQFFNDLPISGGVRTNFNFGVDASFEIGGRLGMVNDAVGFDVPKRNIEYRLAAFVDYGLLDLHVHDNQAALIAPSAYNKGETYPIYNTTSMVDNLVMNDIMSTAGFAKSVNNLMIGLKFTILFQMPEPGQCVICRDAYTGYAGPSKSRHSSVKYEE